MKVGILGVGLLSAGLDGWAKGRAVLAGTSSYSPGSVPEPEAALLPANERRRSSDAVRWAMHVAHEAVLQSAVNPQDVATVFASSGGEMGVLDKLCRALTTADRALSPTLFHQSVHNTAAGYWGIATGCQQSSTALSSYDDSSAVGLLEAVVYATVEERPVLFVVYDLPPPPPLDHARPIRSAFAAALLMTPLANSAPVRAGITLAAAGHAEVTEMENHALEQLRRDNPAGRLLPLLRALAQPGCHRANLNVLDDQRLVVEIEP
jgi:Beta-ketoacyl synthase, N-terminal domain